jgi:hypothetical protein
MSRRGRRRNGPNRRTILVVGAIVALLFLGLLALYQPFRNFFYLNSARGGLTINVGKPNVVVEPDGTTYVVIPAGALGGASPYSFTCTWSDGVQQTSTSGIFQRSFSHGQTIPTSAVITAKSEDGLTGSAKVIIPL